MTLARRLTGLQRGSFDPLDIAGSISWWDFSDISTLFTDTSRTTPVTSDGDSISGVTDKSAVGTNHLAEDVPNGVSVPVYKTAIQNGLSVARFTSDKLKAVNATGPTATTIFIVGYAAGNTQALLATQLGGGGLLIQRDQVFPDTNAGFAVSMLSAINIGSYRFDYTGDAYQAWENGVSKGTDTFDYAAPNSRLQVGAWQGNSRLLSGDVGEVLVYDSLLSLSDHNAVGRYLASKWGFSWTTVT